MNNKLDLIPSIENEFGLSERTQLELLLRLRQWEAEHKNED